MENEDEIYTTVGIKAGQQARIIMTCSPELELCRDGLNQDCGGTIDEGCGTYSLNIQDRYTSHRSFLLMKRVK